MTYAQAVVSATPAPPVHEFWAWSNGTPTTREDVQEAARDGVEIHRLAAWRLSYGTMNVLHVVRHSLAAGVSMYDRGTPAPTAWVRH